MIFELGRAARYGFGTIEITRMTGLSMAGIQKLIDRYKRRARFGYSFGMEREIFIYTIEIIKR